MRPLGAGGTPGTPAAPRCASPFVPGLVLAAAGILLTACRPDTPTGSRDGEGGPPAADVAPADESEREILARIVRAESGTAYHGWRTVSQGPRGESRETRVRVARPASGPLRIAWEGGEGGPRRWTADQRFPWVERPELLLRNYRVRRDPAPAEPVAWRPTERVVIEGRRPGRPSLELSIDAETGLVLSECHRDSEGREWRSARFESVEFGPPPDEEGPAPPLADPPTAGSPPPGLRPLPVTALPAGFERVRASTSPCGAWREDFSDGLAALSVLQSPAAAGATPPGEVERRRWLGGAALRARVGEVAVTVTGTLPPEDLLVVLRGLGATGVTPP